MEMIELVQGISEERQKCEVMYGLSLAERGGERKKNKKERKGEE